ncbi:MAG: XRE family transcriptional regulator [Actinobacteria bacterium]|nr:XRE family transcriptional regulator [Actinomycetota bacterium]
MTASPTVAHTEPEVLRWARESAGYTVREAADRIGVEKWYLELVEGGGELMTLRQAEKAAEVYERPLATLFLPSAPEEESQEVQFRRLPGTPKPPWGAEMQLTARRVTERQQRDWKDDAYAPFRGWREAVEVLGVLVMQDGPVAVEEMRGFASIEPRDVPAILVNNKDNPRARAFTVLHELGHVLLAGRGEHVGTHMERWCEGFAGQVLMPADWLAEEFASSGSKSSLGRVEDAARAFHVTPLAAAVRVARAGLLPRDEAGRVIGQIQRRWKGEDEEDKGGGSYYVNQVARFGPGYLRLVFSAIGTQAITLPTASALLDGVKVKNFESLRDQLEGRR